MQTLRILVVDDEAGMRHSIERGLRRYVVDLPEVEDHIQFEVSGAESGEDALQVIEQSPPDMLLLDQKMGGMSGLEVLETLTTRGLDLPVIMITAFATIETAVRATKQGAFDFMPKPFTPEELKRTIRKAASHLMVQRRARELAQERQRIRFEFISILGHELKAPLAAIQSFFDVLTSRAAGDDLAAYDKLLHRGLARVDGMRKLIDDLLDMTRIEAGRRPRELVDLNLRAVAKAALETQAEVAEKRGIALHLDAADEVAMVADRIEMDIIFNNLVSNAVKYNRDNGSVTVTLRENEAGVDIVVADTGIGLSKQDAERLFNDFVRIRNEHTRNIAGSGLGLSTVKKVAGLYGGDAAVESVPGEGSIFTVRLLKRLDAESNDDKLPQASAGSAAR